MTALAESVQPANDRESILRAGPDYYRAITIAGLFLNHLEHIAVLGDSFGSENRASLVRFVRVALERSPILRAHLADNPASYSDALHRVTSGAGAIAAARVPTSARRT